MKKYSYDYVKSFIKKLEYDLVTEFYKNDSEKLILKDIDGYYYISSFSQLRKLYHPRKFCKTNPYTIQNIKLWLKLNNKPFELISDTYNGNDKKLKWKCLKDDCGEIFKMSWSCILHNQNCPYCSGKQVGLSNCLAAKNPELAKEWHPTKNGDLTPYDVTTNSNKEVWWLCNNNIEHAWKTKISNRNNFNHGCPYCSGRFATEENNLLVVNPDLCKEWNYDKNNKTPENYLPNSNQYVWWICSKGHEWEAIIYSRHKYRNGCPYCSGNLPSKDYNLLIINPKLCEEWHYEKNDKRPEEYMPSSNKEVWWKCSKNPKHEWKALINNRNKGIGCPYCSGHLPSEDYNLLKDNPELCKEWDYNKNNKKPEEYTPKSAEYIWWKCKECGYNWKAQISSRNKNKKSCGCPECNKSKGEKECKRVLLFKGLIEISQEEYEKLSDVDKDKYAYFIPQKEFDGLFGTGGGLLSYDFYLPKYNLLIEYQGIQHEKPIDFEGNGKEYAEKQFEKQQEHDRRKREYAQNNNIKLLEIWYWDFNRIEEILKNI